VQLWVVRQDLDHGLEAISGLPPLVRVGDVISLGGRYDTAGRCFVGPAENPQVWLVGERQAEILLRDDPIQTRTLLYSAEGAGKTVLMAQWLIVQALTLAMAGETGYGGATAPTNDRLDTLINAVCERVPVDSPRDRQPGSWGTLFVADREIVLHCGITIQFRATKRQSSATGSPVQGYTWKFSGDDELQDTAENDADPDIEARLRGARTSRRMCTATAKDSPGWRTFRDAKEASPDWRIERLRFDETPFVWPSHWERMRRNMSAREWQRRGLAMDVGPERQLYHAWDRTQNLMPLPMIGAKDVTAEALGSSKYGLLVGHDPGKLVDVSVLLKAYRLPGEPEYRWVVVGELTTRGTTSEQHFTELRQVLASKWGIGGEDEQRAIVRCDPYSNSSADRPDRSVYLVAKKLGFDIRSASYKDGKGNGQVPKESRIEMVNRLLCSADGTRRLFVGCDDKRTPLAEQVVMSLEVSSRDESGRAEWQRKDSRDVSHWTAALGYGLYPYERIKGAPIRTGAAVG